MRHSDRIPLVLLERHEVWEMVTHLCRARAIVLTRKTVISSEKLVSRVKDECDKSLSK